jgi:hypothetical protein
VWAEGASGNFTLDVAWIGAGAGSVRTPVPANVVAFETFNAGANKRWTVTNDPVMGGISTSKAVIDESAQLAHWAGEVRIVPSLKAPGFCNLETTDQLTTRYPSAAGTTHLVMMLRTTSPDYRGFKVSFAARTLNPQFKSFKTDMDLSQAPSGQWYQVALPWTAFSNDWSPYTGECNTTDPTGKIHHCCSAAHPEVCPTESDLKEIQALGVWTEGASGNFSMDIAWIGAGNGQTLAAAAAANPFEHRSCKGPLQATLRYNVSDRMAKDYLPLQGLGTEQLAEAICCNTAFATYAEPQNFFARPDVALFDHLNASGVTTFYDPVCGVPLFRAPANRTLDAWRSETEANLWPSFRNAEAVLENLVVQPTGQLYSICGTHLGDREQDDQGFRYCVDLSCISGNPAQ